MSEPTPEQQDPDTTKAGDTIAVLMDVFNPPTMDHYRAIEALKARPEIKQIWLCPLPGTSNTHVRAMASIFCLSLSAATVSYCTIALDKQFDAKQAMEWIRAHFPYFSFRYASLAPAFYPDSEQSFQLSIGSAGSIPDGATSVIAANFLPVPSDLKERIKAGSDESRNFTANVWNYIQKHKLYRD